MEQEQRPMSPKELVDLGTERRLFSDKLSGKTPSQTMNSKLSVHVRTLGEKSVFVRTAPGRFYLRRLLDPKTTIYNAKTFRPSAPTEEVLVFPTSWLDSFGRFQGISPDWEIISQSLLRPFICQYMERLRAEQSYSHKQILTYVLVTRGSQVLEFRRGTFNRVEDALRGRRCIGFGGHVAAHDRTLLDLSSMGIIQCAARELAEELTLPLADARRLDALEGFRVLGVLNDDSSTAGRRHLAFILKYEVCDPADWDEPKRGEKSINQLRWLDESASQASLWEFEYWSQLCLREFFPRLVHAQPEFRLLRKSPLRPPHLLCVLGEIGSGKSEAATLLKDKFGYLEVNSGRVLASLLGLPPIPETFRQVFQEAAWQFISRPSGPRTLATALWEQVRSKDTGRVLIDGIRQKATLDELKRLAGSAKIGILFIHALPDVAYQFCKDRYEGIENIHDFLKIRDNPVERQIGGMIRYSDAVLYNWTGHTEYQEAIYQLMEAIGTYTTV